MTPTPLSTELKELLQIFKALKGPLTAARIAEMTDTYPATAKRRVKALIAAGYDIKRTNTREGRRGFPSAAWVLV